MRTLIATSVFMALAAPAMAGTLKEGAIVCLTSKYLSTYNRHKEHNETKFMKDMLDRAQCIRKGRDEDVSEISVDNIKANVQMQDGFKVWVDKTHYMPEAEKAANVKKVDDVGATEEDL